MYCSKCGKEVQDDWRVCPYCENTLKPAAAENGAGDYEAYRTVSPLSGAACREYEGRFNQETDSGQDGRKDQKAGGQTERKDKVSGDTEKALSHPGCAVVWESAAGACIFWPKGQKQSFGTVRLYPDRLKWSSQKDLQEVEILYQDISNCEKISYGRGMVLCSLLMFFSWLCLAVVLLEFPGFFAFGMTSFTIVAFLIVLRTRKLIQLTTCGQEKYLMLMTKEKDHQKLYGTFIQCIKDYRNR